MQKTFRKFLLIFSLCMLAIGGIVWACADGDDDDSASSNFTPEAFVAKEYTPFFYAAYISYYDHNEDNSSTRYNQVVLKDWDTYLEKKITEKDLETLLFKSTYGGIDSVYKYASGQLKAAPPHLPDMKLSQLSRTQLDKFLSYLLLAKECESFTVSDARYYWDEKRPVVTPAAGLDVKLLDAFQNSKDDFIKERLWFQLVRYYYFSEAETAAGKVNGETVTFFNKYASSFPKNNTWYRALGYVAGHYYKQKDYAQANYLYSLCYNFSSEMKIPSKWSFHPQNESDWQKSLSLAKNNEEKITLWQMLGISSDESRAIEEIYAIDPKSEKLELLLSRLVNIMETTSHGNGIDSTADKKTFIHNKELVSRIAENNNTAKPYYWNLAAGYLNTLSGDYVLSKSFYNKARVQLPENNKLIMAQYRILDWTLYLSQLKTIDAKAENQMAGTISWLADLRDGKDTIANLRYDEALRHSVTILSGLYKKQGDLLKANCFNSETDFYTNNGNIEALKALLSKTGKTSFETAMLRYYHLKIEDLYYHQGLMLVYQEKTDQAIAFMEKAGKTAQYQLLGNPFSIHINDCHDCDFAAVQKVKYTPLSFLKAIKTLKSDIIAGKNTYVSTFLLADAYYNITHYGNARTFYQSEITGSDATSPMDIPVQFRQTFTSGKLAEKYYLLARTYAKTREQKARCTFMAAKCERNDIYNNVYNDKANQNKYYWDFDFKTVPAGKYFAELKTQYYQTQYYNEILKECGYFKSYINKR
ncbi:MAG TPA: hypothetical protein VGC08_16280 [Pedobacter sp.]